MILITFLGVSILSLRTWLSNVLIPTHMVRNAVYVVIRHMYSHAQMLMHVPAYIYTYRTGTSIE